MTHPTHGKQAHSKRTLPGVTVDLFPCDGAIVVIDRRVLVSTRAVTVLSGVTHASAPTAASNS